MKTKTCQTCKENKPVSEFPSTGYNISRRTGEKVKSWKPDCKLCHGKRQRTAYHRLLDELVELIYGGWKCQSCGYNKCKAAFDFHHRDSSTKDFVVATRQCISRALLQQELEKCDLLCANCHREHHANEDLFMGL